MAKWGKKNIFVLTDTFLRIVRLLSPVIRLLNCWWISGSVSSYSFLYPLWTGEVLWQWNHFMCCFSGIPSTTLAEELAKIKQKLDRIYMCTSTSTRIYTDLTTKTTSLPWAHSVLHHKTLLAESYLRNCGMKEMCLFGMPSSPKQWASIFSQAVPFPQSSHYYL